MEQLGINPIFLLSQIVNFAVLAIALRFLAYKPILNMLDQRRERIERGLEDARLAEEARANAESERQQILDEARSEAQEIVAEASQRGDAQAEKIVEDAQQEAEKIREEARADAQDQRDRVLGDMRDQIASLALAAANQIVRVSLDEQRQKELVKEFFSGVKDGQIVMADQADTLAGDRATVTTAVPLNEDEKSTYRSYLEERMGSGASVEFRTDPEIVGGVVLRVGDRVVDDSVAGKASGLRQNIG